MKTTKLAGVAVHNQLGTIPLNDQGVRTESTIEMTEKNFRFLLALIPKITTHNALNNEIQGIKDLLTELTMRSNLTRPMIVNMLIEQANRQAFLVDVEELNKTPMIVGKTDIE